MVDLNNKHSLGIDSLNQCVATFVNIIDKSQKFGGHTMQHACQAFINDINKLVPIDKNKDNKQCRIF
jgi:hypothetical protein